MTTLKFNVIIFILKKKGDLKNNNLKTVLTLESNSDVVSYIEELYPYLTGIMLGSGWESPGDFYRELYLEVYREPRDVIVDKETGYLTQEVESKKYFTIKTGHTFKIGEEEKALDFYKKTTKEKLEKEILKIENHLERDLPLHPEKLKEKISLLTSELRELEDLKEIEKVFGANAVEISFNGSLSDQERAEISNQIEKFVSRKKRRDSENYEFEISWKFEEKKENEITGKEYQKTTNSLF